MSKKHISSFILICALFTVILTDNAHSKNKKTTKEEPQLQSEDIKAFIENLKVGDKINGWTVSKIKRGDWEGNATFKGILKTKAKYYNYFDIPWSYGMEFGTNLLLYLDDAAKNKLPLKGVGIFAGIADKKFPKLTEGSYGIMDVEINEINLGYCECDLRSYDDFTISKVVNFKEAGRAVFGEVENFKIYEEQYKIVEDFLGNSLPIK